MKYFFIYFLTLFISIPVFSQQISIDTFKIDEITVTGTKSPRSSGNVTQKIKILDETTLSKFVSGNRNISDYLAYQAGISVTTLSRNDANWGTFSGLSAKYSSYMLQGLPIDAFTDPFNLDMMSIERIEIQKGVASILYPNYLSQDFAGNQCPLAGSINLIMKEKIEERDAAATLSYGSYNTLTGNFYYQDNYKNLNWFGGANYESSDYTDYGTKPSWLNMKKNPEYTKNKIFCGMTLFPQNSERSKISLFYNHTSHKGDAGRIYRGYDNMYDIFNLSYYNQLSYKLYLNIKAGFRAYNRSWQESNFGVIDTLKSTNGVRQSIIPMDISLSYKHVKNNTLTIGSDLQSAKYLTWSNLLTGIEYTANKSKVSQNGIYAQEELFIDNMILRGGLRYNFFNLNSYLIDGLSPGNDKQTWNALLWSGGLKYKFLKNNILYINAGNSFQLPGLKSSGGTIKLSDLGVAGKNGQLPNPNLKPENGLGIDLGYEIIFSKKIEFSARAFYVKITDAIIEKIVSLNPSQTQSINAGQTDSKGIEIEIKQLVFNKFKWFANYTYLDSKVKGESFVPFAPQHLVNIGFDIVFPYRINVSPTFNYNAGYYDSSSVTSRNFFKPGLMINLSAFKDFKIDKENKLTLFTQIYNLTDNKYEMPWQFKNTGIAETIGIKVELK